MLGLWQRKNVLCGLVQHFLIQRSTNFCFVAGSTDTCSGSGTGQGAMLPPPLRLCSFPLAIQPLRLEPEALQRFTAGTPCWCWLSLSHWWSNGKKQAGLMSVSSCTTAWAGDGTFLLALSVTASLGPVSSWLTKATFVVTGVILSFHVWDQSNPLVVTCRVC